MTELFRRRDIRSGATPAATGPIDEVLPWAGEQTGATLPAGTSADMPPPDQDEHDDDDLLLNDGWNVPRFGRLSALLAVGVVAALMFAGGVLVQKHHDAGLASTSTTGRARGTGAGFAAAGGFGAGAFGGAGAGAGTGTGTGAGTGTSAAASPVVVGTLASVSGTTLTVKNFAGVAVVVHVPAGTPVTTPGLTPLAAGMFVSVTGAKATNGSVTASGVVARRAG